MDASGDRVDDDVFVCDWRAVDRFDQAMADTIVRTMRRDSPGVRANGVLVAVRNKALYEQVAQVLHEARKPERRDRAPRPQGVPPVPRATRPAGGEVGARHRVRNRRDVVSSVVTDRRWSGDG
jgi:hypothetical protein